MTESSRMAHGIAGLNAVRIAESIDWNKRKARAPGLCLPGGICECRHTCRVRLHWRSWEAAPAVRRRLIAPGSRLTSRSIGNSSCVGPLPECRADGRTGTSTPSGRGTERVTSGASRLAKSTTCRTVSCCSSPLRLARQDSSHTDARLRKLYQDCLQGMNAPPTCAMMREPGGVAYRRPWSSARHKCLAPQLLLLRVNGRAGSALQSIASVRQRAANRRYPSAAMARHIQIFRT